jgi:hippurate hydrolase
MSQILAVDDLLPELVALRQDLHAHPEPAFEERRTARIVADALRRLGLEVHEGLAGTGVVGTLRQGQGARSIGLRADMDALPIAELSGLPYASRCAGVHHGCGHDGHTAMLIGAARQLARTRRFDGCVHFIFQPAEEGRGGAREMVRQGLFERFPCDAVYALHNWPDLPLGHAQTRVGPIMAAADRFDIVLRGRGAHAAQPHRTPDVLLAASQLVTQLNTIVARRIDPVQSAVLSVTRVSGGSSHNVLPAEAVVTGTVRSFEAQAQDRIEAALREAVEGIALGYGVAAQTSYDRYYPATVNSAQQAMLALGAAADAGMQAGEAPAPAFTSEDFAFLLRERPGAYLWLGQGRAEGEARETFPLHHPCFDFNDHALPNGVRWFCAVVERELGRAVNAAPGTTSRSDNGS